MARMPEPAQTAAPLDDVPRAGMLAAVRNRQGVVAAVEPFDGPDGRLHLVHLEYTDGRPPSAERLLWEVESKRGRRLLEPTALPDPDSKAMRPDEFDAMLRSTRWTAMCPYLDPDGDGALDRQPIASPYHGGVRVEDYQLVPLLKALRMPRVNLLIADDVGLGKTIEAGLILAELLLRRRIRRVLVLTPASLRQQWRDEMWEKFALRFDLVDRHETERLRRRLGMDANPWRSFDRIVTSYHYLRQPDVREQFRSACKTPEDSPHFPWDLLIVDECHNLMPAPFGKDSQLCDTLRIVAPRFEHRLFLSATPHNGHTRSFTGLLEMLDPVQFTRTSEMTPAMRKRVETVVIRRLKREINAVGRPRFCTRNRPQGIKLAIDPLEIRLSEAYDAFRKAVYKLASEGTISRRRAGSFAVEVLGKRLLSCPAAFADSWFRTRQGFTMDPAAENEVRALERAVRQETGDDRETEQREATAATVVGAWLQKFSDEIETEIRGVDQAVEALGFQPDIAPVPEQTPISDARFDSLIGLIDRLLGSSDDERLIVFTEYKTTLDYLTRRLRETTPDDRILTLFGASGPDGMNEDHREQVKEAFNDPTSPVRILIATDAASEGLNLHHTARYLLHFDCPWNPSRLEQRNGRLDRYGQCRDVTPHHFVSDSDPDLRFLDHLIHKASAIREDLGSVNEIFDRAIQRRLVRGEDASAVRSEFDHGLDVACNRSLVSADDAVRSPADDVGVAASQAESLNALASEVDLDADAMAQMLETAMAASSSGPQLRETERSRCYRLVHPNVSGWREVIDESIRLPAPGTALGPMPTLAFSPEPFIEQRGGLSVFSPPRDSRLLHLAHPLMQRAMGLLARYRYPGQGQVSRWTVRLGGVPPNAQALILFSIEELAVNELRETFHRWVRTVSFPVRDGMLGEHLAHTPAMNLRGACETTDPGHLRYARDLLDDARTALQHWLRSHNSELTEALSRQLSVDRTEAYESQDARYKQRQAEVSTLIEQSTEKRLTREIEQLKARSKEQFLFDDSRRFAEIEQSIGQKSQEIYRRRQHYNEIRDQLQSERDRVLNRVLPARFAMVAGARVFPVALEVRLPSPSDPVATTAMRNAGQQ